MNNPVPNRPHIKHSSDGDNGETFLSITCRECEDTFNITVNYDDFVAWKNGRHAQNAFPYLNAAQRELLISGTCGDCWDDLYKERA